MDNRAIGSFLQEQISQALAGSANGTNENQMAVFGWTPFPRSTQIRSNPDPFSNMSPYLEELNTVNTLIALAMVALVWRKTTQEVEAKLY